jgi:hypothetical protein
MKNLEKGAVKISRFLPNKSRVFIGFLQQNFPSYRQPTKVEKNLHPQLPPANPLRTGIFKPTD